MSKHPNSWGLFFSTSYSLSTHQTPPFKVQTLFPTNQRLPSKYVSRQLHFIINTFLQNFEIPRAPPFPPPSKKKILRIALAKA